MQAGIKQWEEGVETHSSEWVDMISRGDAEAIWSRLFHIVSRHSAVRSYHAANSWSKESLQDFCCDVTQELFLRLQKKNRWDYYLEASYTNERVEHELYGIEVPNLVSQFLRERYPESYRLARRISNLLLTSKEFQRFDRSKANRSEGAQTSDAAPVSKMVQQVYGLADWSLDKPIASQQNLAEIIKEVPHRVRDTRRAGRGSTSQVVISNMDLTQLLIEIFQAIDTPTDVRTMRTLALSKLTVEDSQIIAMDEALIIDADKEPLKVDYADSKPNPEEVILEKEMAAQMDVLADDILQRCLERVRNKPQRFQKLVEVVWHCYFNQDSSSQTHIAKLMDISDSLVSHYRKIFDSVIHMEDLCVDEWIHLNSALDKRLDKIMAVYREADRQENWLWNHQSGVLPANRRPATKYYAASV